MSRTSTGSMEGKYGDCGERGGNKRTFNELSAEDLAGGELEGANVALYPAVSIHLKT